MEKVTIKMIASSDKLFYGEKIFDESIKYEPRGKEPVNARVIAYKTKEKDVYICAIVDGNGEGLLVEKFDALYYLRLLKNPKYIATDSVSGQDLDLAISLTKSTRDIYNVQLDMLNMYNKFHKPFNNDRDFLLQYEPAYHRLLIALGIREKEEWL